MNKEKKVKPAFNIKSNKITVITPPDLKVKDYLLVPASLN